MVEQGAQREPIEDLSYAKLERRLAVQTTLGQAALAESTQFLADAARVSEGVDMEKPLREKGWY